MNRLELLPVVVLSAFVLLGGVACTEVADQNGSPTTPQNTLETESDSSLAKALNADEYGMHRYVLALLKEGPNRDQDSTRAAKLQKAHLANIRRLADQGKLILSGPFLGGDSLRGIYVFNVSTVEEARKLTETDPAMQAGRLEMELHPWYGSAALQEVNKIHNRISKKTP